jgi:alanyl-tRNA synthetase
LNSKQIRQAYLEYFHSKGHTIVPSSSLIPGDDPTLLFTNAGMVQFKDVFLGVESRSYVRATSSQRCVRAGGKHNDLENVGYTARHHTFFEMLGNFSFGDYFKREAIQFAWDFLTNVLHLSKEKLWVTVYEEDKEAEDIWLNEMKVDSTRFSRCGKSSNFWSMGDTGPCGPCTEIFYDHGAEIPGGPPGSPDEDGDRYIEIWNLVFMQYDRSVDGKLTPLAKQSVDTGMGFERLTAVLQGVHNNYDTDIFVPIIKAAAKLTGTTELSNKSLRVIADHIRSTSFLMLDGVRPSNEGRGYVLRRIIRRAIRHGYMLGLQKPFFYKLVPSLVEVMGEAYPDLSKHAEMIAKLILQEEEQFGRTVDLGMKMVEQEVSQLKAKQFPAEVIFKLYDTYGFPIDLTADILRERQLSFNMKEVEAYMNQQRQQSKAHSQFKAGAREELLLNFNSAIKTDFLGYEELSYSCEINELYVDSNAVGEIDEGQSASIILDKTPFYAESGGQVGDIGTMISATGAEFEVQNTFKKQNVILHSGIVRKAKFKLRDKITAQVNEQRRKSIALHHSATHLLHAALRKVLGDHVVQKGSLVEADKLRFDFAHGQSVTAEQIEQIEYLVNQEIRNNSFANMKLTSPEAAQKEGAMALFGEKYGDVVRVLSFGDFSKELCGGTHVNQTGDIGAFKIISESGIAAGVRRIEAVAGEKVFEFFKERDKERLAEVARLQEKLKQVQKKNEALEEKSYQDYAKSLIPEIINISGIKLLFKQVDSQDKKCLKPMVDYFKGHLDRFVIVLAVTEGASVSLMAAVSQDLTKTIKAGELISEIANKLDGKGGGRPDLAQGACLYPEKIAQVLSELYATLVTKL